MWQPFYGCPVRATEEELLEVFRDLFPEDKADRIMKLLREWVDHKIAKATTDDSGWQE